MCVRTDTRKALREKRGKSEKRMNEIIVKAHGENQRALTAEEDTEWNALLAADNQAKSELERFENLWRIQDELQADQRHGVPKDKHPASATGSLDDHDDPDTRERHPDELDPKERETLVRDAFHGWTRAGCDRGPTRQQCHAARRLRRNCNQRTWSSKILNTEDFQELQSRCQEIHPKRLKRDLLTRDMTIGTGSSGGYAIPQGFMNALEIALLYYGPMMRIASIIRTDSGNPLPWPTFNDTSNTGEMLAESASIGSSVDPTFGQAVFGAYKMSSKVIKFPYEWTEDNAVNGVQVLADALGQRLGRVINTYATTGTGTSQPGGIVTGSTLGKTTASATAVTYSEIIDLIHSVDVAYREQPGVGFMFHDLICAALRKLVDSQSRPLWQSGLSEGVPDRLLGYSVNINNSMSSALTTGLKVMLFGWLPAFKMRIVNNIRMRRLTELYAANDQEAFIGFLRVDSKVLNAGTNPIKYLITA